MTVQLQTKGCKQKKEEKSAEGPKPVYRPSTRIELEMLRRRTSRVWSLRSAREVILALTAIVPSTSASPGQAVVDNL